MTIRAYLLRTGRRYRLAFLVCWAMTAVPGFFRLGPPYSYGWGLGIAGVAVTLLAAYRSIRCPRCGGSAWMAGMRMAPLWKTGPGHGCPRCEVSYEAPLTP